MDILIGAATESILSADLLFGHAGLLGATTSVGFKRWDFPLYIPAGSRISAQSAGARVGIPVGVLMYLHGGTGYPAFNVGSRVVTYGMGTVPNGTTITPGASGVEGSWAQIAASTSEDHLAVVPSFQVAGDPSVSDRNYSVDVGIGAATEEMIREGYLFATDGGENMSGPLDSFPCFHSIPAGSRLVMRASNGGTNDGSYNGVLHCVS
jgi:hypothetical protein